MLFRKQPALTAEAQRANMLNAPIPQLVTRMAIPMIVSQMISVIYNTADTYFVSQISTSASAATGIGFSLMSMIQAFGGGFSMGAKSLVSRHLGAGETDKAAIFANSALLAVTLIGLIVMVGGLALLPQLMLLMGATPTMLEHAMAYARYILIGAPVMCASFVLKDTLSGEGEPVFAMLGLTSGGLLNMALDPLFIFRFNMGIAGAALATMLSQCVSFLILLSAFLSGKSILPLNPARASRRPRDYLQMLQVGSPTIFRQGMASIGTAMITRSAGVYGDAVVAAVTISNKIYILVRNLILGIGQGFQPVAGFNYGAGCRQRTRRSFVFTCEIGTALCIVAAILIHLNAAAILRWFRDDDEVIRIGVETLHYICLFMPLMAFSTYVNQLYQCLGFSAQATFLACCRHGVCLIPVLMVLPRLAGIAGVEASQPIADALTFLVSIPFLTVFLKKRLAE